MPSFRDSISIVGSRIVVLSPHPGRVKAVLDTDSAADDALGSDRARALHEEISAMLFAERFEKGAGI